MSSYYYLKIIYKENPIEVQNILISKSFIKKILLKWKILPIDLNFQLLFMQKILLKWKIFSIGLNVFSSVIIYVGILFKSEKYAHPPVRPPARPSARTISVTGS